jgi:hypothetical protein
MDLYRSVQQTDDCLPAVVYPAAPVEPFVSPGPVVWVVDAYGRFVPMPKDQVPPPVQPTPPRDLTPVPLIDPRAQIVAAGGIGAGAAGAGIGWGVGQAAAGIAAIGGSSALIVAAALYAAVKLAGSGYGGTSTTRIHNETTVHNNNRWWGHSTTTNRH